MPRAGRKEAESTVDFRQEIVILCERLLPTGIDMIMRYFDSALLCPSPSPHLNFFLKSKKSKVFIFLKV